MRGKCSNKSSLPKLVIQHGDGKEKEWLVESVCRFYKSQLSLSERLLSSAKDQSVGGFNFGPCSHEFSRLLQRFLPNRNAQARSRKDCLYHPMRHFLLQGHAFRDEECWAKYQRMITKMFKHLMGSTMDAHINDMW